MVDELWDRSFGAYIQGRHHSPRIWPATCIVACFSAGLIISQGILGLEIVLGTLVGGVLLAYPLWQRWGRAST